MLVEGGRMIRDGGDLVGYLDEKMENAARENKTVTGIIISSDLRSELTRACHAIMGIKGHTEETVNRFRGALLIEDGDNTGRVEVIMGANVTLPADVTGFGGFKPVQAGRKL